ncbi:MAG: nitroreductase [Rhodobacteraceae bacterium]|nr:nitroreductase [Paracoccaceae bacterium]
MKVSQAVAQRRSCRAFLSDPVASDLLCGVFERAARAASGGNLQPWRVYLLNGEKMQVFKGIMADRISAGLVDTPAYAIYPHPLHEPYRSQRYEVGETMYGAVGVGREDKAERRKWFARNYQFFGAPAAAFLFVDRAMGPAQWSDLGGYLATVQLLLEEQGLASCAQESWVTQHKSVQSYVQAPPEQMLFCGIAIGTPDREAPINQFMTTRAAADGWLREV